MNVFGPVPSRRLGRSLGINNIPPKICSYSCVYCQLGRTLRMEIKRRAFYEPEELIRAVRERVEEFREGGERIDYLTFVPDGEPTLDSNLGEEIAALKDLGIGVKGEEAFMPHYEKMNSGTAGYPLTLVPYEIINLASGNVPSPPFLYKTIFDDQLLGNDSFVAVNPETASEYRLEQGDPIVIESPAGAITARVNLSQGAMPGIVYMPMGFGHTAYDEFIRGKGVNPNDIIDAGKDPLSGQPAWWATPVKITKV